MLNLHDNEKVHLIIHKHWFVMAHTLIVFLVLLFIPPVILTFLPLVGENLDMRVAEPLTNLFLVTYSMVLLLLLFLFWMDHYLDMWIITSERIIDVEQDGLFSRKTSEIPLENVQDVTIEIRGIIETFLKFGTIRIQTAGEREFTIHYVPHLYEAKDIIIRSSSAFKNGGTQ